ncbi:class I SAM-dependent methyltransferase (plasmid) [Pedobacter sp. BS3]|uniref:class I SAM-dependent methyltransferase n=1 Tax=Pedobacter sp. BS3 TaxID=2567937 RepID=UPI0011EE0375|nr:class I SAM-dependent methyltransferase [Pedobacter sp. BS3]TZF86199.1 class I SAM-dependent methyltransferase [Pedobacter sp. BS3]
MKDNSTLERLHTEYIGEVATEHLHRYAIAAELTTGKTILDIACGEGYGSHLLSNTAAYVYGIDIDKPTIDKATIKYRKENLSFKQGTTSDIPLDDNSVDIIVSFETIEHHDEHQLMMREFKRVLRKDGLVIISTPDKLNYSDKRNYKNEFHIKELYKDEFESLLKENFQYVDTYFQKMTYASIVVNFTKEHFLKEFSGDFTHVSSKSKENFIYLLCIASDTDLPALGNSYFIHSLDNIIQDVVKRVRGSLSYRLGNALLSPARFCRNLFR